MKNLNLKPFFVGAALVLTMSGLTSILPAAADRDAWTWTDKSSLLPAREGVKLSLSAERQGAWLLSDGRTLVRFDGIRATNLTGEARDHGVTAIKSISSDGRQWLIWNKPLDDRRGSLWLLDNETWTDMTNALPTNVEWLEVTGHDGQWYLNATANGITRLVFVNGTASIPQDVTLPLEAPGRGHAAFMNGRWFWFGEQAGRLMTWSLNGLSMTPVKNVPSSTRATNVWSANGSTLIATTNGLWNFNGSTWTDLGTQANALGLATDTLMAAHGGTSWMILSGNNVYRYDGVALASKGTVKHRAYTVSGGNGFVLTGSDANGYATLSLVSDDVTDAQIPVSIPAAAKPIVKPVADTTIHPLTLDAGTGIASATWNVPTGKSLPAGETATYIVATQDKTDGINSVQLWLNGVNVKTCALDAVKTETRCEYNISASQYPTGTDIFMNARIEDGKKNAMWTNAITLSRPAPVAATSGISHPTSNISSGPAFATRLVVTPDVTDIRRGGTLTVRAISLDNLVGMERVEMSYGGQIRQMCRYGVAMSEVVCDLTIDTATFADNTSLSFVARAINTEGKEAWSNGKTVLIRPANWSATPSGAATVANGLSQWSWLSPATGQIEATQEATYGVGTWSPDGIAKIEMIVNGSARKTCGFATGLAARECSYVIRTPDWNHGQLVTVNARITDNKGRVTWSEARSVTVSRAWWEAMNRPGAYATVSANKNDSYVNGETLTYTMTGWSPNGADRLELYVNGDRVTSCPSDICRWSAPAAGDRIEYQARLVDRQGKETWTGLYGLNKK